MRKCKSSILSSFSQGAPGAQRLAVSEGLSRPRTEKLTPSGMITSSKRNARFRRAFGKYGLYAPSVALGVLEGTLHFFAKDLGEDGAPYSASTGLTDVRGAIAAGEYAEQRLLDPIRFER